MKYDYVVKGFIGSWWNGTTADDVNEFLSHHEGEELHIAIASLGGDVNHGLQIREAFRNHGKVHAHIIGTTASSATICAMGAKTVDIGRGALMLIHNASQWIDLWGYSNKEQLEQMMDDLKKTHRDLTTFDNMIADIYSLKNGKTREENLSKMAEGAWLSPQDALDWGLVDSIRDEVEEIKDKQLYKNFVSNYINAIGLPPLPGVSQDITDGNGVPTKTFLQRVVEGLKDLFKNQPDSLNNKMKKVFANLCACLSMAALEFSDDKKVELTEDQIQKIEDYTKKLVDNFNTATAAQKKAEEERDDYKSKLDAANEQIKNLKGSAGGTHLENAGGDNNEGAVDIDEARKTYNAVMGI